MDKLIEALVREVRLREGHDPCAPIDKGLLGNLELRIKGWVADSLAVCKPESVLADNRYAHDCSMGRA